MSEAEVSAVIATRKLTSRGVTRFVDFESQVRSAINISGGAGGVETRRSVLGEATLQDDAGGRYVLKTLVWPDGAHLSSIVYLAPQGTSVAEWRRMLVEKWGTAREEQPGDTFTARWSKGGSGIRASANVGPQGGTVRIAPPEGSAQQPSRLVEQAADAFHRRPCQEAGAVMAAILKGRCISSAVRSRRTSRTDRLRPGPGDAARAAMEAGRARSDRRGARTIDPEIKATAGIFHHADAARQGRECAKRGGVTSVEVAKVDQTDANHAVVTTVTHFGDGSTQTDTGKVRKVDGKVVHHDVRLHTPFRADYRHVPTRPMRKWLAGWGQSSVLASVPLDKRLARIAPDLSIMPFSSPTQTPDESARCIPARVRCRDRRPSSRTCRAASVRAMRDQAAQREPHLDCVDLALARPRGGPAQDVERQVYDDPLMARHGQSMKVAGLDPHHLFGVLAIGVRWPVAVARARSPAGIARSGDPAWRAPSPRPVAWGKSICPTWASSPP